MDLQQDELVRLVNEADAAWFEDHPTRAFRFRFSVPGEPLSIGLLMLCFCPSSGAHLLYPLGPGNYPPVLVRRLVDEGSDAELSRLFCQVMEEKTTDTTLEVALYEECRRRGRRMTATERQEFDRKAN